MGEEQHSRMVLYLQSRLNDLRNENLSLREKFKSSAFMDSNTFSDVDFNNTIKKDSSLLINTTNVHMTANAAEENGPMSLRTSSIDGDEIFECNDEILQQKIRDLQKLQMQLNDVKT